MKTRALLLLVCLMIPMQHAVIGQQACAPRIANDWCYPRVTDNGCAYDASASSDQTGACPGLVGLSEMAAPAPVPFANYRYFAGGTYTITLTVADNANQTSTVRRVVTVVAPPPPTMHVGDLDGTSTTLKSGWYPYVTIALHTENHGSVAGVMVSGVWDDGSTSTCTTDESGRCSVSRTGVRARYRALASG